jgi:predicted PurR-regulated permease PerM
VEKTLQKLDTNQRRILSIVVLIAVIFGAYFLWGYFTLIVFAAILAFLFSPVYKRILARTKKPGLSSALTIVVASFAIIIPIILLVALTIEQAIQIADDISKAADGSSSLSATVNNLISNFNSTADDVPGVGPDTLSFDQMSSWVKEQIPALINSVVDVLKSFAGGIAGFFTQAIIFLFVFGSLLRNQDKLISLLKRLNPLGEKITDLYLNRTGAMTTAMIKGQFTIAVLQGFTDAALMWIVGIDYFFFWFVLLTFLSIIPLGGGIIVIPIGIIMLLTGNIWQGLVLLGGHFLIVTNIDNILRPRFVPKSARLDPALTILSVFSGIAMFGFLGIVIGPVIMITIVTTIQVYLEAKQTSKSKA